MIKILLIADDRRAVKTVQKILLDGQPSRFELLHSERLSDALQRLQDNDIELILLDLSVSDVEGIVSFRKLQKQAARLPIIVLVSAEDQDFARAVVQEGAQDYFVKGQMNHKLLSSFLLHSVAQNKLVKELQTKVQQLSESENRFRNVIEKNADGVIILNKYGKIRFMNPAAEQLFNRKAESMIGEVFGYPVFEGETVELEIIRGNGETAMADIRVVEIEWKGEPAYLAALRDITVRKQMQAELDKSRKLERYLAYHDALTRLPNRHLFYDRLNQAIMRANRYEHKVAVLFLDLDRFKNINDSLGHNVGDQLLKSVASRLQFCIRESDSVARLGGDEFTIVLDQITQMQDAAKVSQKIIKELEKPFHVEGNELNVTASIGISLYPTDGKDIDTLVRNSDIAMYRAKREGNNLYQFYNVCMDTQAYERLELENNLRIAIEQNQLVLHYQPQVDLISGRIVGVEALVRWLHPHLGLLPPYRFISLAEESGLIVPIGEWVLRTACHQNKAWQKAGCKPVRVSVNLSPRQFRVMKLKETVQDILKESKLDAQYLALEITESNAMQNVDYTITTLNLLKEMGIQIAIDDFGTGYASLNYLKRFPFDILKIDRSFINGLHELHDDWAIVSAIIAMAHRLNLKVLAEGVENEEQIAYLRSLQCDEIQGFHISRPVDSTNLKVLLKNDYKTF
ncbi:MAG: putative bifunctional diguanylate cyclase/phosphodiesterase [bacterium]